MIYPGTDTKWKLTCTSPGFTMSDDRISLDIFNRWGQVVLSITKEDMLSDSEGNYYFCLPNVKRGVYYANVSMIVGDGDFPDDQRHTVCRRYLCSVGACDCNTRQENECSCDDGISVAFERVWWVNLLHGAYLCDKDGNPILDADGNPIYLDGKPTEQAKARLNLTIEQLKRLLEERDSNGTIDTLPEAFDALGGINDDTELSVMTDSDTADMMNRILKKQ